VRSTIDLGHNLGLSVVAEGVETDEMWRALAANRCDVVQGYLLSRPLAAPEVLQWMQRWSSDTEPVRLWVVEAKAEAN
jgi:EAL domain-containing protein (putative c-di-GMP-specific phosphodiesterase class I)